MHLRLVHGEGYGLEVLDHHHRPICDKTLAYQADPQAVLVGEGVQGLGSCDGGGTGRGEGGGGGPGGRQ